MRTSARKQKSSSKCQQGPPPPHTRQKGLSCTQWFVSCIWLRRPSTEQIFTVWPDLGGLCLLPKREMFIEEQDLNGASKWCLSERDLGTVGEQFDDLPGSAGESRDCSFPHKLFQEDGLNTGVSVTWLIVAPRNIPGISASSCRLGMRRAPGHPVQTPTWDGAFLHHCLRKSSQAAHAPSGDVEDLGPDL